MKLTKSPNDQYVLVSVCAAIGYLCWVIYEPTLWMCNSLEKFFPIGRVLIYWGWLIFVCLRKKSSNVWLWKNFIMGAACGGIAFVLPIILYNVSPAFGKAEYIVIMQPLVWVAPYSAVAGIAAGNEKKLTYAAGQGFVMLFYQVATDLIVWYPWSCTY